MRERPPGREGGQLAEDRKDLDRWGREGREDVLGGKGKDRNQDMDQRQGSDLWNLEPGSQYGEIQMADIWRMSNVMIN